MANILLGVCGGIAAYKSCELVRELERQGDTPRVIMTQAAQKFVTPLTFESLTRAPVHTALFGDGAFGTAHIEIARWADLLVVAPMTAHTLFRFVHGAADDFLSTVYLAFRGPIVIAPAMNTAMWEHPATQQNLVALKKRGVMVIEPESGELACGEIGAGKMAEPKTIASAIAKQLAPFKGPLSGKKVVITAGPTREYLDPVRFFSNPSTGKMGLELAKEAAKRGADVTLIHGPLSKTPALRAKQIAVTTAEEMSRAVKEATPADIFVSAAAVSDYRPAKQTLSKLKKSEKSQTVQLEKTEDIVDYVSRHRRPGDLVIGFAAETEDVVKNGRAKLKAKALDLIIANPVYKEEKGFVQDRTQAHLLDRTRREETFKDVTKSDLAFAVWNRVENLYESR